MSIFDTLRSFFGWATPTEADTAGPAAQPLHVDQWSPDDQWHVDYRRADAHPGRLGRSIAPWGVVVHETQMHPSTFEALVKRTQRVPGAGNCYHFLIGRVPGQLVQVAPLNRNANHAGGTPHGWIWDGHTKYHPNLVTVGIELHCAGALRLIDRVWRTSDEGKPFGAPIPDADVRVTGSSLGIHAEHLPTAWQLDQLGRLLTSLALRLPRAPQGVLGQVVPDGEPQPHLPVLTGRRQLPVYTHRQLSPARKTDPSRATLEYLEREGW